MPGKPLLFLLSLLLASLVAGQQNDQAVEFLHLTDTHIVNLTGVAGPLSTARSHFANSGTALSKFLAGSERPPAASFALVTGDLIDAFSLAGANGEPVYGQIAAFQRAIEASRIPLFLALGNHDIQHYGLAETGKPAGDHSVAGEARAAWIAAIPSSFRRGTFYSIEKQAGGTKYVILMLDNGYSAAGSADRSGRSIAHEQLYWLRRQSQIHRNAVLILAMHIPLGTDSPSESIKNAVAGARSPVVVLAGHNHRDGIEDVTFGDTTGVQVRTAAFGYGVRNWRRVRLTPQRVEVFATGKSDQIEKTIDVKLANTK